MATSTDHATAAHYADPRHQQWMNEGHYIATLHGRAFWETAYHTRRGGSIRLMRLDNETLTAHRSYVRLDAPMRLVRRSAT